MSFVNWTPNTLKSSYKRVARLFSSNLEDYYDPKIVHHQCTGLSVRKDRGERGREVGIGIIANGAIDFKVDKKPRIVEGYYIYGFTLSEKQLDAVLQYGRENRKNFRFYYDLKQSFSTQKIVRTKDFVPPQKKVVSEKKDPLQTPQIETAVKAHVEAPKKNTPSLEWPSLDKTNFPPKPPIKRRAKSQKP